MSSKRKQSTLSQSSSESDPDTQQKKSKLDQLSGSSGDSSSEGSDKEEARPRKSRSKSSRGSDSGTARSKSSSNSRSRSKSSKRSRSGSGKSKSRSRSAGAGSDSGTGGSRQSSPAGSRAGSSGADSPKSGAASPKSGAGSPSQQGKPSAYTSSESKQSDNSQASNKSKKLKKGKDHKASAKLQKTLSNSDSEDESAEVQEKKKRIPRKPKKSTKSDSSDTQADWRDEFGDGLDDEYIGGEEDRNKLERMTEREREEEFYKRAEKREELKKRFEISQKLKKQQQQQQQRDKSSGSEGELREDGSTYQQTDPGSRKKGYEEKYGKKFSALNMLKAKREEKERKEKLREERQKKNKKNISESESGSDYEKLGRSKKKKVLKASEIYSSSSSDEKGETRRKSSSSSSSSSESDGESDTERQDSKKTVKKALNIETIDELEKIRLSRFRLDKFVHLPIFKKTVVGCFVRIGIGKNTDTGKDVYRCCEIMDVCETGKVYNVMKTKTNIGLKLRHGKDTRIFRLRFVSNSPVSDSEFEKWRQACVVGNLNLPTVAHLAQKEKDIKYAMDYKFSSYDVEKILASKKRFSTGPKNFAMHKAELMKERDKASVEGRQEESEELNRQLEELEERAEALDKTRTSTISTISLINDRNRKNNVARAYTGIQADEKRRKIEGHIDDPFTRRKTRPKLSAGSNKGGGEEHEMTSDLLMKLELEKKMRQEQEAAKKEPKSILPPPVDITKPAKGKTKGGIVPNLDIFDAHNFDLDINVDEIQTTPLAPSINLKPVTASSTPSGPTKRSLKLDEWKKKRGII